MNATDGQTDRRRNCNSCRNSHIKRISRSERDGVRESERRCISLLVGLSTPQCCAADVIEHQTTETDRQLQISIKCGVQSSRHDPVTTMQYKPPLHFIIIHLVALPLLASVGASLIFTHIDTDAQPVASGGRDRTNHWHSADRHQLRRLRRTT